MKTNKLAIITLACLSVAGLSACVSTGTSSISSNLESNSKPYLIDEFGVTTATFHEDGVVIANGYSYSKQLPYSIKSYRTEGFTFNPIFFSNYATPPGHPDALIYDGKTDTMLVVEAGSFNKPVKTTESLAANKPRKVLAAVANLARSSDIRVERDFTKVGYTKNAVKGVKQPYERTRFLVQSMSGEVTEAQLRDDVIKNFYGLDYARTTSGIDADTKRKFMYVDAVVWSDATNKSKLHVAYFVHAMPTLSFAEERAWEKSRKDYLNIFNLSQF